jgi:hypothetical protein
MIGDNSSDILVWLLVVIWVERLVDVADAVEELVAPVVELAVLDVDVMVANGRVLALARIPKWKMPGPEQQLEPVPQQ